MEHDSHSRCLNRRRDGISESQLDVHRHPQQEKQHHLWLICRHSISTRPRRPSHSAAGASGGKVSIDTRFTGFGLQANYAATVPYDRAVELAEFLGKRLPTALEYQYAATNRGTTRFPWGDWLPEEFEHSPETIGPVGDVIFDTLPTSPPVVGLCSNVAELTSSWGTLSINAPGAPPAPASTNARDHGSHAEGTSRLFQAAVKCRPTVGTRRGR